MICIDTREINSSDSERAFNYGIVRVKETGRWGGGEGRGPINALTHGQRK